MRGNLLWWFLPDEALPLLIVGAGLLVIVRVIRPSTAVAFLFGVLILPMLVAPLIEAAIAVLPLWLVLLIGLALVVAVFRAVASFAIGRRAADHMVGTLAADSVYLFGRLCLLPFRLVGRSYVPDCLERPQGVRSETCVGGRE